MAPEMSIIPASLTLRGSYYNYRMDEQFGPSVNPFFSVSSGSLAPGPGGSGYGTIKNGHTDIRTTNLSGEYTLERERKNENFYGFSAWGGEYNNYDSNFTKLASNYNQREFSKGFFYRESLAAYFKLGIRSNNSRTTEISLKGYAGAEHGNYNLKSSGIFNMFSNDPQLPWFPTMSYLSSVTNGNAVKYKRGALGAELNVMAGLADLTSIIWGNSFINKVEPYFIAQISAGLPNQRNSYSLGFGAALYPSENLAIKIDFPLFREEHRSGEIKGSEGFSVGKGIRFMLEAKVF